MQTQQIGSSPLIATRLAYGCMRLSWQPPRIDEEGIAASIRILETAVEAGYTLFDNADIYGRTACEMIFGRALKKHPQWRERLVVVTKCGIRVPDDPQPGSPHRYDFSREHILRATEASLRRLGVETIDLLLLHRPDFLADPEEIGSAFIQLRQEGKVREFGVSNFRPSLVAAVQSGLPFALQANQVEIHPARLDCFTDGTLDQCLERRITPMAWSPLDRGRVAAGYVPEAGSADFEYRSELLRTLDEAAGQYGCDRTNIVLAWLLRHPSRIIPVIGTTNPERIRSAARATEIAMDRETWYRILRAARGEALP